MNQPAAIAALDATYTISGATLVDGVTLEVNHGELVALVGPMGQESPPC